MYQFTEDCRIGIPQIDKEHEYLFSLINNAFESLNAKGDEAIMVTKYTLKKLQEYAENHFLHEEEYMKSIQDPELPLQEREHKQFVAKINEMMQAPQLDADALHQLLQFLVRWLYRHILSSDMMIGKNYVYQENEPFAFTPKFHTGIPLIDEEHKELFSIIARTNDLIYAEFLHDKYDKIMEILTELRLYTEKHFKDEEEYMETINYPQLPAQRRAHSAFVEKLVEIDLADIDAMDDNQQEYLEDLIQFLSGWLINHILEMDKPIGSHK